MKIANLSAKELLHVVDVAIKAALSIPELKKMLSAHSMDDKKIQVGLTLAQEVEVWQEKQEKTQENARQAQKVFKGVQDSIKALYRPHRETARFAYRQDAEQLQKLQLTGTPEVRYAKWFSQMENFYAKVDTKVMAKYGVPTAEITQVKELLSKLSELEVLRNDTKRQAQQTTQRKQVAVKELRAWFSRFMRVARLACIDDPQLLESMGVVVPS